MSPKLSFAQLTPTVRYQDRYTFDTERNVHTNSIPATYDCRLSAFCISNLHKLFQFYSTILYMAIVGHANF
jgi:hypothetical protein